MQRDSTLIGLLAAGALVMALLVAFMPRTPRARADTISQSRHFILMSSGTGVGTPDMVDVIDKSDRLLLMYMVQNRVLTLSTILSLRDHAPHLGGGRGGRRRRRRGGL